MNGNLGIKFRVRAARNPVEKVLRDVKESKELLKNMVENAMGHISRPSHAAEQCAEVYLITFLKLFLLLEAY